MRRRLTWIIAVCVSGLVAGTARADDPLRLVPDVANLVIKVEQPRPLIDMLLELVPQKELQGFRNYREFIGSTNFRRFQQFLAHFERELGMPWPELVDQLAGNGIALASKVGEGEQPALLIIEGKNPELTKKFWKLAGEVLEQELARQELKQALERKSKGDVHALKIGDDFHASMVGSTIMVSNKAKALEAAYELHTGKSTKHILDKQELIAGRKLAGDNPLAWLWFDLDVAKKQDGFKNVYELPSSFFPLPLLFGGLGDSLSRSDYLTLAISREGKNPVFSFRLPAGRDGLHEALVGHVPPEGFPGLRPLLEPPGVLFSMSYYHDLPKFWENRAKILPADQLQGIEEAEKNSGRVLFGAKIGELFNGFGARHRLVAVRQTKTGYPAEPQIPIPAFAWVFDTRDPEGFAQKIEPPLRAAGLLASSQIRMKLVEETHGSHKIIGYRFNEQQKDGKIDTAFGGVLPNFSPCFVRVGDQFIFCSTLELAHTLIDELGKEQHKPLLKGTTSTGQFYWSGLSSFLAGNRDQLVTQSILAEGSTKEEAQQQVELLLDLLTKLGGVEFGVDMEKQRYKMDVRARVK
jgi:hypothetical protein